MGTQEGGIIGLDPDTLKVRWSLEGLVNAPVVAVEEGYDGHYVWAVQGSPNLFHLSGGGTTTIETGLQSPVQRMDRWQNYLVVQSDDGVRFIDVAKNRVLPPEQVLQRSKNSEQDVIRALATGPAMFRWDNRQGMIISVSRYGQFDNPKEEGGTRDKAYVRAWRVDQRNRTTFLGGYFSALTPFADAPGSNRIAFGEQVHEGPKGQSALANFAISREGLVVVTKQQLRVIPFARRNWMPSDPIPLPVPVDYAPNVTGNGNVLWFGDDRRLFLYQVDSDALSVYVRRRSGTIRSLVGDETGVWVATDSGVERIVNGESNPGKGAYVQLELRGRQPVVSGDQRRLQAVLTRPNVRSVNEALRAARLTTPRTPPQSSTGDLHYGDVVRQNGREGFFVGKGLMRIPSASGWAEAPIDITGTFTYARYCAVEAPIWQPQTPGAIVGSVAIGPRGLRWDANSPFDRPHLPQHYVMDREIRSWMGTPYEFGGTSRSGIDCSGFVHLVFRAAGVRIPRQSQAIRWHNQGTYPTDQLKWGDVIAIDGHVLMYAGGGRTAESLGGVGVTSVNVSRYARGTVRRFIH